MLLASPSTWPSSARSPPGLATGPPTVVSCRCAGARSSDDIGEGCCPGAGRVGRREEIHRDPPGSCAGLNRVYQPRECHLVVQAGRAGRAGRRLWRGRVNFGVAFVTVSTSSPAAGRTGTCGLRIGRVTRVRGLPVVRTGCCDGDRVRGRQGAGGGDLLGSAGFEDGGARIVRVHGIGDCARRRRGVGA